VTRRPGPPQNYYFPLRRRPAPTTATLAKRSMGVFPSLFFFFLNPPIATATTAALATLSDRRSRDLYRLFAALSIKTPMAFYHSLTAYKTPSYCSSASSAKQVLTLGLGTPVFPRFVKFTLFRPLKGLYAMYLTPGTGNQQIRFIQL